MALTRRELLTRGTALGAAVAVSGTVESLYAADPAVAARRPTGDYGPLIPDPDGLLDLPRGFRYEVVSRQGQPLSRSDGVVPSNFDGQFLFGDRWQHMTLVRNHEIWSDDPAEIGFANVPSSLVYDPAAHGGTTTVRMNPVGHLLEQRASLAGTFANCSGGHTPWGTWLSGEEDDTEAEKTHGWVFEVDPHNDHNNVDPTPLKAMGRFSHESVAIDPVNGIVYETEDESDQALGLFYRFLPDKPLGGIGSLRAGGRLQAMRVPGVSDLSTVQETGTSFSGVEWVDVPDPLATRTPTRMQDYGPGGVARSQKLEGAWWGTDEQVVYFTASFARNADGSAAEHDGQVWRYSPKARTLELVMVFTASPTTDPVGERPDQICASPYGGLMLCEDSDGENYLLAANETGEVFPFARNRQNTGTETDPVFGELSGVVFSADGRTLFLNCYTPGTTFAITGPWRREGRGWRGYI